MEMPEVKYETDDFSDILMKDSRYDSRAYDFVMRVIVEASTAAGGHVSGRELLDVFRNFALDAYGPLTFHVLTSWGLHCTEDIGEVVFNLYNSKRIGKTEKDSMADFIGVYNFSEEFLGPYEL